MQFLLKVYSLKGWSHCAGIPWLEQLRGICLIPVRSSLTRLLLVAQPDRRPEPDLLL